MKPARTLHVIAVGNLLFGPYFQFIMAYLLWSVHTECLRLQ